MDVARFRSLVREIDLWTSSCMVATANDDLVGVLLAAKRPHVNRIWRVGIHPDHVGQGHGGHLVTSLGQKLAILGPRRIVVETPETSAPVRSFFGRLGYREERRYADFRHPGGEGTGSPVGERVTLADLESAGALDPALPRSWDRDLEPLRKRTDQLGGWAIASDVRVEAFLLASEDEQTGERSLDALGATPSEEGRRLLDALVRSWVAAAPTPVRIRRLGEDEAPFDLVESWGFRRGSEVVGLATEPVES